MKKTTIICLTSALLIAACTNKSTSEKENVTSVKEVAFINQLYLFQEAVKLESNALDSSVLTNALYLTDKGNVIVTVIDEPKDTISYFWGTYKLTDSTLSYRLTDEFYYPGSWEESAPDFTKGRTRKFDSEEVSLKKSEFDSLSFYRLINKDEKLFSVGNRTELVPQGISYSPYDEKENEKFITWRFNEIPELADL